MQCELTGSERGQMQPGGQDSEVKSSHIVTTTESLPSAESQNSEAGSNQIASDADVSRGKAGESGHPAADAVVEEQASTVDSGQTEPAQCPVETDHLTDEVAECDQQPVSQPSPPLASTADLHAQSTVDSEADTDHSADNSQQEVPGKAAELSEHAAEAAVKHPASAVDAPFDQSVSEEPPLEVEESLGVPEHDQEVEDVTTQSSATITTSIEDPHVQPAADSKAGSHHLVAHGEEETTMVDETLLDDDVKLSQSQSELHREPVDSHFNSFREELEQQTSDGTDRPDNNIATKDEEQTQPMVESDRSISDDIIQQHIIDEQTEKQTKQQMQETAEVAIDQSDSQLPSVDRDEFFIELDNSVDEPALYDDADKHLKPESTIKTTLDEQPTAAGSKDNASGYLASVVNMWAAVDVWLIRCIDNVSSKCVHFFMFHSVF